MFKPAKCLIDLSRPHHRQRIKDALSRAKPYREWIDKIRIRLDEVPAADEKTDAAPASLLDRQQAFGYSQEDIKVILEPMLQNGEEPTGSMGTDSALPILSAKNKTLYTYFKQLFAQVTNPPIDPIREELVMSLVSFVGPKPNLLNTTDINPPIRLEVSQPVLTATDMEKLRHIHKYTSGKLSSFELDICYPVAWGKDGVEARLASLAADAEDAVRSGANILIVSDRKLDETHVASGAARHSQHLVKRRALVLAWLKNCVSHHFALLGGYGAEAVHPLA
jgi:glutamate synthase (NADPH/NADH) large chain